MLATTIQEKYAALKVNLMTDEQLAKFLNKFSLIPEIYPSCEIYRNIWNEAVSRLGQLLHKVTIDNADGLFTRSVLFNLLTRDLQKDLLETVFEKNTCYRKDQIFESPNSKFTQIAGSKKYFAFSDDVHLCIIDINTGRIVKSHNLTVKSNFVFINDDHLALVTDQKLNIVDAETFDSIKEYNLAKFNVRQLTKITENVIQIITDEYVITMNLEGNGNSYYLPAKVNLFVDDLEYDINLDLSYTCEDNKLFVRTYRRDYTLFDIIVNSYKKDFDQLKKIYETQTFKDMPKVVQDLLKERIDLILKDVENNHKLL